MRVLIWVLIFLVIGGFVIVKTHQIDMDNSEGRTEFIFKFTRWVYTLGKNLTILTGQIISMDWIPDTPVNETQD